MCGTKKRLPFYAMYNNISRSTDYFGLGRFKPLIVRICCCTFESDKSPVHGVRRRIYITEVGELKLWLFDRLHRFLLRGNQHSGQKIVLSTISHPPCYRYVESLYITRNLIPREPMCTTISQVDLIQTGNFLN